MKMVNLEQLKCLSAFTPLSAVPGEKIRVSSRLFRLTDDVYLVAVPHNEKMARVEGESFVTVLMWAVDDGAAKRVQSLDIEADTGAVREAPREWLLAPEAVSYGAILREAKTGQYGSVQTYADCRVATDGKFLYNVIHVGRTKYFFRSSDNDVHEHPFAIQYQLSGGPKDLRIQ